MCLSKYVKTKGLFYWNHYYNCVRRFVVSDPELSDSLYAKPNNSNIKIYLNCYN